MTTYTIPDLRMPEAHYPPGRTPLYDRITANAVEPSIFSHLARDDHPVLLALRAGVLRAERFNQGTGELAAIPSTEWYGTRLWQGLHDDPVDQEGFRITVLLVEEETDPVALLMRQIDSTPGFPPKLRHLIDLYYRHNLHRRPKNPSLEDLRRILKGQSWESRPTELVDFGDQMLKHIIQLLRL
jgi:hypothetical protein